MLDYIRNNPGQTRTQIAAGMGSTVEAVARCTRIMAVRSMIKSTGDGKGRVEKRWYAIGGSAASMGNAPMFRRVPSIFSVAESA